MAAPDAPEPTCWAVYRELEHSPEREHDDALILQLAAGMLAAHGFRVRLMAPDELADDGGPLPAFLVHMCERADSLARLDGLESRGVLSVNRPLAVRNAHRDRSLSLLERAGVPVPRTRVVATGGGVPSFFQPCWIKRTDHKTRAGDVGFARTREEAAGALDDLHGRGIARAVLQEHVDGDLLKFYGVGGLDGDARWLEWMYHRNREVAGHPFRVDALRELAFRAAACVDLEVFGGDVIVDARGGLFLIDLNAWPSFALFRDEASLRIGEHLAAKFRSAARC
jgi:hypothetical protein